METIVETQDHEIRHVRMFFESQSGDDDEEVTHVEKVASERILGTDHDVFDVHTTKRRWWVITNPTNLYSHEQHPSMDEALSFHVGLSVRILERSRHAHAPDDERDRFARAWRRFDVAVEAFNRADEAEEFQNVAAQCRQCLVVFINELDPGRFLRLDDGEVKPKRSDFKNWSAIVARGIARNDRVRTYLRSVAAATWDMVAWLVHYEDAIAYDAELVLDATSNTLRSFGTAVIRFETRPPERCPECDSYRVITDYRPELEDPPYVILCEACSWEEKAAPWCGDEARDAARSEGIEPVEEDFQPPPAITRRSD